MVQCGCHFYISRIHRSHDFPHGSRAVYRRFDIGQQDGTNDVWPQGNLIIHEHHDSLETTENLFI